ncbi:insulin-induced gene 1 protein-like [Amphibalanus amphitrite]|uniref:insulin-induced gene 1 protein-like n=1 Tax=Amphibalanus amphitrite TaxID=1232801 RepID=UPI001C8FD181|nr:insulin-induced gene 1 protein-like [Amphibalanus amphitrite]
MSDLWRGSVLFSWGCVATAVLRLMRASWHAREEPLDWAALLRWSLLVAPLGGVAAIIVGLAYPLFDRWLNSQPASGRDWASVTRCLALFVGINHANSRFHFATDAELAWTLALLSLALWWTFDRTTCGFVIASLAAAVAHVVAYYLVLRLVFSHSESSLELTRLKAWFPFVAFSAGITIGSVGRQLAAPRNGPKLHCD